MRNLYLSLALLGSILLSYTAAAQTCLSEFTVLADAVAVNGCYRLTNQGVRNSVGAIWSPQAITLTQNFDLSFAITQCGQADGVVFVLQSAGPSGAVAESGESLGYYNQRAGAFARSVGIELDFFQNAYAPFNDPASPHLMLALNGNPTPVQGPIAVPELGNCNSRILRVRWDRSTSLLTVQLDGKPIFSYSRDLITSVFAGNSTVWFGFVGSTGGQTATQLICPRLLTASVTTTPIITVGGATTLCAGERVVLSVPTYATGSTYAWSPAAGLNTTTGAGVVASPAASTWYRVRVTTPGGCQYVDSVYLALASSPTVAVSPRQVICPGDAVLLTATSAEAGTTHTWAPTQGLSVTAGEVVRAMPPVSTLYTVTTRNASCSRLDTIRVIVRPALQLTVSAVAPAIPGGSTQLTATSLLAGTTFGWSPAAGLSTTTGAVVTATPNSTTTYTVTATSAAGCREQATVAAQPLRLPNIITPNGDNLNDTFRPLVALEPVTLQVFTRWGRLVFEQANYLDGWGAENLTAGTYYYRLSTAQGQSWKGWVEVVR
jgi:gliding motility-associated-like protein